jgi:hypothetical protein
MIIRIAHGIKEGILKGFLHANALFFGVTL